MRRFLAAPFSSNKAPRELTDVHRAGLIAFMQMQESPQSSQNQA